MTDPAPGSTEWLRLMTASKVPAVLGLSRYDDPRSLYHKMRGDIPPEPQTTTQARGHYLEPAILAWHRDQHPGWRFAPTRMVRSDTNDRYACTPDAFAYDPADPETPIVVQAKSTADDTEWGDPGTDEIPVGYTAQVMWEMWVTGAKHAHIPIIGARLEFAEYRVDYDPHIMAAILMNVDQFMRAVDAGDPPPVTSHPEVYRTFQKLHADIDKGAEVTVTWEQAAVYVQAQALKAEAEPAVNYSKALLADLMGRAQYARTPDGQTLCRRQAGKYGVSIQPARTLPTIPLTSSSTDQGEAA